MRNRDDVLLYAAGLLDPAERAEVEVYLAHGGPRAAGELAEAEATLAQLGESPEPIDPPARAKDALLARAAKPRGLALRVIRGEARGRESRRRAGWAMAFVSAAAASAIVYLAVQQSMTHRIQRLEQALVQHESVMPVLEASATALEIVRSRGPEVKVIELEGPALRHRGFGRIYQNWQTGDCYLYVRGLRSPKRDHHYQVWFTTMEGDLTAGGRLRPDASGSASFLTRMPRDVDLGAPVVVTLEPGEAASPSGAPQLVGEHRL